MEAYTSFARVYDTFMDNIPYEEWCEYLTGLMRENTVLWMDWYWIWGVVPGI